MECGGNSLVKMPLFDAKPISNHTLQAPQTPKNDTFHVNLCDTATAQVEPLPIGLIEEIAIIVAIATGLITPALPADTLMISCVVLTDLALSVVRIDLTKSFSRALSELDVSIIALDAHQKPLRRSKHILPVNQITSEVEVRDGMVRV